MNEFTTYENIIDDCLIEVNDEKAAQIAKPILQRWILAAESYISNFLNIQRTDCLDLKAGQKDYEIKQKTYDSIDSVSYDNGIISFSTPQEYNLLGSNSKIDVKVNDRFVRYSVVKLLDGYSAKVYPSDEFNLQNLSFRIVGLKGHFSPEYKYIISGVIEDVGNTCDGNIEFLSQKDFKTIGKNQFFNIVKYFTILNFGNNTVLSFAPVPKKDMIIAVTYALHIIPELHYSDPLTAETNLPVKFKDAIVAYLKSKVFYRLGKKEEYIQSLNEYYELIKFYKYNSKDYTIINVRYQ